MIIDVKYGPLHSSIAPEDTIQGQYEARVQKNKIPAFFNSIQGGRILGMISEFLLSGGDYRQAVQSYGAIQQEMRDYNSARNAEALYSGYAHNFQSETVNKRNQKEGISANNIIKYGLGHYMRKPGTTEFNPWKQAKQWRKTNFQRGGLISHPHTPWSDEPTGSGVSQYRQRGKDPRSKNMNYLSVLKQSEGSDKGSGNAAVMSETYSAAETQNSGFSSRDFTSPAYAQNFAKLEMTRGSNLYNPLERNMFKEQLYKSDTGLVRRVPRQYL